MSNSDHFWVRGLEVKNVNRIIEETAIFIEIFFFFLKDVGKRNPGIEIWANC
jgi:hypothetical protein